MGPPVANLFMADLEEAALRSFKGAPEVGFRYVDDVLLIMKRTLVESLLLHLNTQHDIIQYTVEVEADRRLPFKNLMLQRRESGITETSVYHKTTHTDCFLPFNSQHLPEMKRSV